MNLSPNVLVVMYLEDLLDCEKDPLIIMFKIP